MVQTEPPGGWRNIHSELLGGVDAFVVQTNSGFDAPFAAAFGSERSWWRRLWRRRTLPPPLPPPENNGDGTIAPNRGFVVERILNLSLSTSQFKEAFLVLNETPPLPSAPVLNCHCAGLRIHPVGIFAQNRRRPHIRCAVFFIY